MAFDLRDMVAEAATGQWTIIAVAHCRQVEPEIFLHLAGPLAAELDGTTPAERKVLPQAREATERPPIILAPISTAASLVARFARGC